MIWLPSWKLGGEDKKVVERNVPMVEDRLRHPVNILYGHKVLELQGRTTDEDIDLYFEAYDVARKVVDDFEATF